MISLSLSVPSPQRTSQATDELLRAHQPLAAVVHLERQVVLLLPRRLEVRQQLRHVVLKAKR